MERRLLIITSLLLLLTFFAAFFSSCVHTYDATNDEISIEKTENHENTECAHIDQTTSNKESDTVNETFGEQTIYSEIDSESETIETAPQYRSPLLDAYTNMSAAEIYEGVLKENWVVMTEGRTKSHKIELWDAFLESVNQGTSGIVTIANYTTWNDLSPLVQERSDIEDYPRISLTELYYDGTTFMKTTVFIYPDERSDHYVSLPYLLSWKGGGFVNYYLGQYEDSKPPHWSVGLHGYSVDVFTRIEE